MNKKIAQTIVVVICILLAILGSVSATIGALREASSTCSPGEGIVLIIEGTIALGFAGIIISIATKLLHNDD